MSNDPSNPNAPPPDASTALPVTPAAQTAAPVMQPPMPMAQPAMPVAQPPMPPFAQQPQMPFAQPQMPPQFAPQMAPAMQPPFAQQPQFAPQGPYAPQPAMPFAQQPQMPFAPAAMQPQFAPMPMAQPPMPVAQPAPSPAANLPVIGMRDQYRFAEEAVAQKAQVSILEQPKVAPELPSPSRIDPNLEQLKIALEAQMARNAIAPMMYAPPNATRWFRFSPFELFLEQVLARKLWTLE